MDKNKKSPAEVLQELKEEVKRLNSLLEEDETGFSTWWMFLKLRLDKIAEIRNNYFKG